MKRTDQAMDCPRCGHPVFPEPTRFGVTIYQCRGCSKVGRWPNAPASGTPDGSQRTSKYGAIRKEIDGYTFDSTREARHYQVLKLRLIAGQIADLELQPEFEITTDGPGGKARICRYRADFRYREVATGRTVIEDVKGYRTPVYRLKKKLVEAQFGIEIEEV